MKIFYTILIIFIIKWLSRLLENKSQEALKKENEKLSKFLRKS